MVLGPVVLGPVVLGPAPWPPPWCWSACRCYPTEAWANRPRQALQPPRLWARPSSLPTVPSLPWYAVCANGGLCITAPGGVLPASGRKICSAKRRATNSHMSNVKKPPPIANVAIGPASRPIPPGSWGIGGWRGFFPWKPWTVGWATPPSALRLSGAATGSPRWLVRRP